MYIACAGERLLLLEVEYRERSGRKNRSDLAVRFVSHQKLNRILCDVEWEEIYPLTDVSALCREKSDHVPLLLDT